MYQRVKMSPDNFPKLVGEDSEPQSGEAAVKLAKRIRGRNRNDNYSE